MKKEIIDLKRKPLILDDETLEGKILSLQVDQVKKCFSLINENGQCWIWQGSQKIFDLCPLDIFWYQHHKKLSEYVLRQKCETPNCVNPLHWEPSLIYRSERVRQNYLGRFRRLSKKERAEVQALYNTGNYTYQNLHTAYNISLQWISDTIKRREERLDSAKKKLIPFPTVDQIYQTYLENIKTRTFSSETIPSQLFHRISEEEAQNAIYFNDRLTKREVVNQSIVALSDEWQAAHPLSHNLAYLRRVARSEALEIRSNTIFGQKRIIPPEQKTTHCLELFLNKLPEILIDLNQRYKGYGIRILTLPVPVIYPTDVPRSFHPAIKALRRFHQRTQIKVYEYIRFNVIQSDRNGYPRLHYFLVDVCPRSAFSHNYLSKKILSDLWQVCLRGNIKGLTVKNSPTADLNVVEKVIQAEISQIKQSPPKKYMYLTNQKIRYYSCSQAFKRRTANLLQKLDRSC